MKIFICGKQWIFARSTIILLLISPMIVIGQEPDMLGEMDIQVKNPATALSISVDAVGNVWGSISDSYPLTHGYDHRSATTTRLTLKHLDREDPPGTDSTYFAYGKYKITIEGNYVYLDYRDCDYQNGEGDCGTGYSQPDLPVYYNKSNGRFYKDGSLTDQIAVGGTVAIWEDGRKDPGTPTQGCFTIPVTVQNDFSGSSGGQVAVDNTNYNSPYSTNLSIEDHTIAAISPQTVSSLVWQYSSWSDAGAQSHTISPSVDETSEAYTAYFSVLRPLQVTVTDVGGEIGDPVHLYWQVHPNNDVSYKIYRKPKYGSESLVGTKQHSDTSWSDLAYNNSDDGILLYYDVRAYHSPSSTYANPHWYAVYGEELSRWAQGPVQPSLVESGKPNDFSLQCYPNPFNPSITFRFGLPAAAYVTLKIYDILGREVATLVSGERNEGYHSIEWNAEEMPSGMYVYRLQAGSFVQTGKILLTK